MSSPPEPLHGPYPPTTWSLGGLPMIRIDVPITAVFLGLFMLGAATHMTILQVNLRHGHKFLISGLLFGFCMARIASCVLRIAAICLPHNANLNIAASVIVAAGVVLLYVINLVFTQRVLRSRHPNSSWHPFFSLFFGALIALTIVTIAMIIVVVIQSFFTLNKNIRRIDHDIQLYGVTFFAAISFLPILFVALGILIPSTSHMDHFGTGRFRLKVAILVISSGLLCMGAAFKAGTLWLTPVPRTEPVPWYFTRTCFYVFQFSVEICVVYIYALLRVDQRFHIRDGAKGPGSYSGIDVNKGARHNKVADSEEELRRASARYGSAQAVVDEKSSLDRPLSGNLKDRDSQEVV